MPVKAKRAPAKKQHVVAMSAAIVARIYTEHPGSKIGFFVNQAVQEKLDALKK